MDNYFHIFHKQEDYLKNKPDIFLGKFDKV